MLEGCEVVDSPTELAKMCWHTNQIRAESSYSKQEKSDHLVCKPDYPVLSIPMTLDEGASPPTKRCLDEG
jgi:hypothetical protein